MRKLVFTVLTMVPVVVSAGAAGAGTPAPFKCIGSPGAITISGDLEVPAGHTCELIGTTVTGNVTDRGRLFACAVHILGNLTANHAQSLVLGCDSTVGGNVLADHTTGGPNFLCTSTIGGNVNIQQSSSNAYWQVGPESETGVGAIIVGSECGGITVGGNLIFQNNRGGGDITDNTIGGNLNCHNNDPAPYGANNAVAGSAQEQCAGF